MSLRTKVIFLFVSTYALLTTVSLVAIWFVISTGYSDLEASRTQANVERLREAIGVELDYIDTKLSDWALWDDTYQYMEDFNAEYEDSNLQLLAVETLKLNFMVFVDGSGSIVTSRGVDLETSESIALPPSFSERIRSTPEITTFNSLGDKHIGIFLLSGRPLMFGARPIGPTNQEGDSRGTLIFARYLDSAQVERLATITHQNVEIFLIDDPGIPLDVQNASQQLTVNEPITVSAIDADFIHGYLLVTDPQDKPLLIARVKQERSIFQQGIQSFITVAAVGTLSSSFIFILIVMYLGSSVISPIIQIQNELRKITTSGNSSDRIALKQSRDEIGRLREDINSMLGSLEEAQGKLSTEIEKTKHFVDNVDLIVVELSTSAIVEMVNKKASSFLEYAEGDIKGKNWIDLCIPEGDRPGERSSFEAIAAGNSQLGEAREKTIVTKSGIQKVVRWRHTVLYDPTGKVNAIVASGEDVTEKKKAEEKEKLTVAQLEEGKTAMLNLLEDARDLEEELKKEKANVESKVIERTVQLRDQQARLIASIENLPRAFIMTDTEGNILMTNRAVSDIIGRSVAPWTLDILQERLVGVFDIVGSYKKCLSEKQSVEVRDIQFITKIIQISLTPIFVGEKKEEVIGVLILVKDETEEKILQRSRDEFFSIASHELRTPLTAIRGNASMIKDFFGDKIPDAEVKEMIGDIYESSRRLITIVNDFLDVSRLELGKIQYKIETTDPVTLIEGVMKEIIATAAEKQIALVFEKPPSGLPRVFADIDRTKQVVFNLVGNAIKFTEKGGVTIKGTVEEGFVRIAVADTGRGIPYKSRALLFRKFQQAGDSLHTRDTTKGTGLGLYISKMLIEGMKGNIRLDSSNEGQGSVFSFTLPIAK